MNSQLLPVSSIQMCILCLPVFLEYQKLKDGSNNSLQSLQSKSIHFAECLGRLSVFIVDGEAAAPGVKV